MGKGQKETHHKGSSLFNMVSSSVLEILELLKGHKNPVGMVARSFVLFVVLSTLLTAFIAVFLGVIPFSDKVMRQSVESIRYEVATRALAAQSYLETCQSTGRSVVMDRNVTELLDRYRSGGLSGSVMFSEMSEQLKQVSHYHWEIAGIYLFDDSGELLGKYGLDAPLPDGFHKRAADGTSFSGLIQINGAYYIGMKSVISGAKSRKAYEIILFEGGPVIGWLTTPPVRGHAGDMFLIDLFGENPQVLYPSRNGEAFIDEYELGQYLASMKKSPGGSFEMRERGHFMTASVLQTFPLVLIASVPDTFFSFPYMKVLGWLLISLVLLTAVYIGILRKLLAPVLKTIPVDPAELREQIAKISTDFSRPMQDLRNRYSALEEEQLSLKKRISEKSEQLEGLQDAVLLRDAILTTVPEFITLHDSSLHTVYCNWRDCVPAPGDTPVFRKWCTESGMPPCDECQVANVFETGAAAVSMKEDPVSGRVCEVSLLPVRDENGFVKMVVEHVRDVTRRRSVEEKLHVVNQALEQSPVSVVIIDVDGNVRYMNERFLALSNVDVSVMEGKNYRFLNRNSRLINAIDMIFQNMDGKTGWQGEVSTRRSEKDVLWENAFVSQLTDKSGKVTGVLVVLENVTESKQLEGKLVHAQKMEAVGHLAGGIAHDFNNILTAIIGSASLMEMKLGDDSPYRKYVRQILESSDRAAYLTKGLLAFSRKQFSNPKIVDINEVVRAVEGILYRFLGEEVMLTVSYSDTSLPVRADMVQIEQVLINLITNARDAMPNGGRINLVIRQIMLDDTSAQSEGLLAGQYVCLTVADSGCGIESHHMEHIFEPFFTTKEVGKGTGLGLSIAYGIVQQHRGAILCQSEVGIGTTFRIYLPLIPMSEQETEFCGSLQAAHGSGTVLLAEDDSLLRETTHQILEECGFSVIDAVNGKDAVQKYRENKGKIDVVLMDVVMPEMGGMAAASDIFEIDPNASILFTSGYNEETVGRKGGMRSGMRCLQKPVRPAELVEALKEEISKRRI